MANRYIPNCGGIDGVGKTVGVTVGLFTPAEDRVNINTFMDIHMYIPSTLSVNGDDGAPKPVCVLAATCNVITLRFTGIPG